MTEVLTPGETMRAFRAAAPFRQGGAAELTAVAAFAVVAPGDWQGLPTQADLDLRAGSTVR
ncbi:hypothetical protein ACIRG5_16065 [Lentzea sp. NPDC102401]|uniref:hypothetical protein n=1 Tax=Lentzea sp. NPDC102401 TaxID=3364128 RepID=UPI00381998D1